MNVTGQEYQHQSSTNRTLIWLVATVAVFGSLLLANYLRPELIKPSELAGLGYVVLEEKAALGELPDLVDHDGNSVDASLFEGKWTLVFFGFTYCPDVCPTTLSVLSEVTRSLGDDAPQVVLVSLDPERDAFPVLRDYVKAFDPAFVGVTGEHKALNEFSRMLYAVYSRTEGPDYQIEHSTHIAAINPRGEFSGYFRIPHRDDAMVEALRLLM